MAAATIAELTAELVTLVKQAPSVGVRGYSVFDTEELETIAPQVGYPLAGVSYEGGTPQEHSVQAKHPTVSSVNITTLHFLIVIGNSYKVASDEDTKPVITDLLDEVRSIVLGYQGVNNRPWRYTGELPLPSELEGAILYGTMWETDIPVIGNSPN